MIPFRKFIPRLSKQLAAAFQEAGLVQLEGGRNEEAELDVAAALLEVCYAIGAAGESAPDCTLLLHACGRTIYETFKTKPYAKLTEQASQGAFQSLVNRILVPYLILPASDAPSTRSKH